MFKNILKAYLFKRQRNVGSFHSLAHSPKALNSGDWPLGLRSSWELQPGLPPGAPSPGLTTASQGSTIAGNWDSGVRVRHWPQALCLLKILFHLFEYQIKKEQQSIFHLYDGYDNKGYAKPKLRTLSRSPMRGRGPKTWAIFTRFFAGH